MLNFFHTVLSLNERHSMFIYSCNSSAKPPSPIKLVLVGGDFIVSSCLRHYVDLLSSKPPDWQGYLRFYVVPLGNVLSCNKTYPIFRS